MGYKPLVLIVAGPTASGKTGLGVELALKYNGEVISADSMQIYKGMDILTAKPTKDEMKGIPHHLIGFLNLEESFSVADYLDLAKNKINEVISKGKQPIVVGGTGLYISSLMDNVLFEEVKADFEIRNRLIKEASMFGNDYLLEKLRFFDPETAKTLHCSNLHRIIRAIEVHEITGKKISELKLESKKIESPYDFITFGVNYVDRGLLYEKINKRVDVMMERGLLEEAYSIYTNENLQTAFQAIGYKEFIPYFKNEKTLSDCIEKVKMESRRYAKRQLTWFRRDARVNWMEKESEDEENKILKKCEKIIANYKIV